MIYRYGESIKVVKGKSVLRARAIIQPLMYKNKMYLNGSALPAGTFDGGIYLPMALGAQMLWNNREAYPEILRRVAKRPCIAKE